MHAGSHAGNYETSLMLAAAPQLVDEAVRVALPELAVDLPAAIKAGAKSFPRVRRPRRLPRLAFDRYGGGGRAALRAAHGVDTGRARIVDSPFVRPTTQLPRGPSTFLHPIGRAVPWVACVLLATAGMGCPGPGWRTGGILLADDLRLSAALGEPERIEAFDPAALPAFERPTHLRPCCGFGMDIAFKKQAPLAYFTLANILDASELGSHNYDSGAVTVDTDLAKLLAPEKNGLIYTCRGGFVDIAHVRDNMDLTLFLFYRIAAQLPGPMVVSVDGDNSKRELRIKEVPAGLMRSLSRWEIARRIAEWAAFRLSIWHEVATYYGDQSIPGISEKVSAFTPEDLYSNALGIRLAGAILSGQRLTSRTEWNTLAEVWIQRGLTRLQPVGEAVGREAMHAVDGLWWDSSIGFEDWRAVKRRALSAEDVARPWTVQRSGKATGPLVQAACGASTALPLKIADADDLAELEIAPGPWAGADFPWPGGRVGSRVLTKDLPGIVEAVRTSMRPTLGDGFDAP